MLMIFSSRVAHIKVLSEAEEEMHIPPPLSFSARIVSIVIRSTSSYVSCCVHVCLIVVAFRFAFAPAFSFSFFSMFGKWIRIQ